MGTILFCVLSAYCDIFSLFMQISPENCLIYLKIDKYKKNNKYKKQFRVVKHDDLGCNWKFIDNQNLICAIVLSLEIN